MSAKFQTVSIGISINIIGSIILIVGTGVIFGSDAIVGLIMGITLVGIFLISQSLITGSALKNARDYHENNIDQLKNN